MCDISVFLEGNVIDLGSYKLQVAEACSGLRYLFPLMTLGFIAAYFFKGAWWKRAVIFLSTLPIAVLMNSLRIGAIGIAVEYWGIAMAEGILHDFEGWLVFMICIAILVAEMWVLARCGRDRLPLREAFGIEFPVASPPGALVKLRDVPKPYVTVIGVLALAAAATIAAPERNPANPPRESFVNFPLQVDGWNGRRDRLESVYLDILQMDDYVIADYADAAKKPVNFFVAYYRNQLDGGIHSPRACVPAGGWAITSLVDQAVPGVITADGSPLVVNRAEIRKGEATQIVYYWFQQRGRSIAHEYEVKWYLLTDSIRRNRSDGALVRLVTPVTREEDPHGADRRLASFAAAVYPQLAAYVPD
jgi:exosortase D (VPLPA-CTERM-specific)